MTEPSKRAAIFSSSSQLLKCREYAAWEGYSVVTELLEDASDTTLKRPGIQTLFTAAQEGTFDTVLIPSLDMLSGESDTAAWISVILAEYGVRCISITQ